MKDINSNNEEERNNFNAQQKREEGNMKGINRSVGFCFQDSFRNLYYGHPRREVRRAFPVALLLLTLVLGMCILPGLAVADDPTEQIKPLLTGEDAE
ncbi:hypothetical protein KA005_63855, partial [bacterium]|nr:hypothetical protein [bacterium]